MKAKPIKGDKPRRK